LGPAGGKNIIQADYPGLSGAPARFTITGLARDLNRPTTFTGVVLDNANHPVGGASCTLAAAGKTQTALSDENGHFTFSPAPAGAAQLTVDGHTATLL